MEPYCVQRAKFSVNECKNGIDSILSFDYMGSAEFEFGALPNSLKVLRQHIDIYVIHHCKIFDKKITIFCKKEEIKKVKEAVEGLAQSKYYLKEYCDFEYWVGIRNNTLNLTCRNDFWWDIDNHFMFWKRNKKFTKKFEKLIVGK